MEQTEASVTSIGRWAALLRGLNELAFGALLAALAEQEVD
jgi:hypothetical protein